MNKFYRFSLSIITVVILLILGIQIEGTLASLINQFWFSSGILLVILLSLVDQPFFSKDSNIFVNAISASVPLLLIAPEMEKGIFYVITGMVIYLTISSFMLMFLRGNKISNENKYTIFFSKINQIIGKPITLFSILFLWGISSKYGLNTNDFNSLLIFWCIFIMFNNEGFSISLLNLFNNKMKNSSNSIGVIFAVIAQNTFLVKLSNGNSNVEAFDSVEVIFSGDGKVYKGIIFEKLLLDDEQWIKIITNGVLEKNNLRKMIVDEVYRLPKDEQSEDEFSNLIGIILEGSTIGKIKIHYNSKHKIYDGTVLEIKSAEERILYQVIEARTELKNLSMMNQSGFISAEAIQLGTIMNLGNLSNMVGYLI